MTMILIHLAMPMNLARAFDWPELPVPLERFDIQVFKKDQWKSEIKEAVDLKCETPSGATRERLLKQVRCIVHCESSDRPKVLGPKASIGAWTGHCQGLMQLCPTSGTLKQCKEAGYPISDELWKDPQHNIGCGVTKLCDSCMEKNGFNIAGCSGVYNAIATGCFDHCMDAMGE